MKNNKLIFGVVILGFFTLFFFPEPETNLFAYIGTGLVFLIVVLWLAMKKRKKNSRIRVKTK